MKRKVLLLVSIFLSVFIVTGTNAKVLEADDNLNLDGTKNSSVFAFGNDLKSSAKVDGISFFAGNTLSVDGESPYGFYAGNVLSINASVEKDLFVAGNSINIGSDAKLGRDVYIVGNSIKINADVERNLRVAGSEIDLSGITVKGNVYTDADIIKVDSETVIQGKFVYLDSTTIDGEAASVGSVEIKEVSDLEYQATIGDRIYDFIISSVAAIIVMVALFYMLPNVKKRIDEDKIDANEILSNIAKGFVALLVIPFIAIIALVTGFLTPLALIVIAIYAICLYLASLASSYIVGKEIASRAFKQENVYLSLCIGIILVKLIKLVPYIGGLVSVLCLFYGFGIMYKLIKKNKEEK